MNLVAADRIAQGMRAFSQATAWCAGLVATFALAGWFWDITIAKSFAPNGVPMNPATALTFLLAGASLLLLREGVSLPHRRLGLFLAGTVALVGLLRLGGYALIWSFGLDQVLFRSKLNGNVMAPNTAFFFLLIGLALAVLDVRPRQRARPTDILALIVCLGSFLCLVGYLYDAQALYGVAPYIPMAANTAALFHLLSMGILAARPGGGLVKVVADPGIGGMTVRRLLVTALVVPLLCGWLRLLGERAGLYGAAFGVALMVACSTAIFTAVAWWTGAVLMRIDAQRRRAAEALEHSAAEIRDLYDNAPCGYHSLDENGVIIAINATELRWLGYSREEVVGKRKFVDFVCPEHQHRFFEAFPRFKIEGQVNGLEFDIVRKNGEVLPIILNATAVYDSEGRYVASRTTLFDNTERRRAEEAIRLLNANLERLVSQRTAELAESNRALQAEIQEHRRVRQELAATNRDLEHKNQENEMFVYSVSHDLRSPLVNLQGFSNELHEVCKDIRQLIAENPLPPELQQKILDLIDRDAAESIRFIQTAVRRLSNIIDALLRLSRAGRVEYQWSQVDLPAVIERILDAMKVTIDARQATVAVGELPTIWGDSTAVEQVFANLISNAVKYLAPDRPGKIEIGMRKDADHPTHVTVYVADNGLGIPEGQRAKAFQAFQRLHPEIAPGEGIGLTIVRRIVERHGGRIWIESEEGLGTTFCVSFPVLAHSQAQDRGTFLNTERTADYAPTTTHYCAGRGR